MSWFMSSLLDLNINIAVQHKTAKVWTIQASPENNLNISLPAVNKTATKSSYTGSLV